MSLDTATEHSSYLPSTASTPRCVTPSSYQLHAKPGGGTTASKRQQETAALSR